MCLSISGSKKGSQGPRLAPYVNVWGGGLGHALMACEGDTDSVIGRQTVAHTHNYVREILRGNESENKHVVLHPIAHAVSLIEIYFRMRLGDADSVVGRQTVVTRFFIHIFIRDLVLYFSPLVLYFSPPVLYLLFLDPTRSSSFFHWRPWICDKSYRQPFGGSLRDRQMKISALNACVRIR